MKNETASYNATVLSEQEHYSGGRKPKRNLKNLLKSSKPTFLYCLPELLSKLLLVKYLFGGKLAQKCGRQSEHMWLLCSKK